MESEMRNESNDSAKSRPAKRIIGRARIGNVSSSAQAAKPYVNKRVYAIYNVSNNESVQSLSEFIEKACGVKPLSCFKIKSNDTDSSSFRVCINASVCEQFLDPNIWDDGIVIRIWKFKAKSAAAVNSSDSSKPQLPVADEPTTAMEVAVDVNRDATVQSDHQNG